MEAEGRGREKKNSMYEKEVAKKRVFLIEFGFKCF